MQRSRSPRPARSRPRPPLDRGGQALNKNRAGFSSRPQTLRGIGTQTQQTRAEKSRRKFIYPQRWNGLADDSTLCRAAAKAARMFKSSRLLRVMPLPSICEPARTELRPCCEEAPLAPRAPGSRNNLAKAARATSEENVATGTSAGVSSFRRRHTRCRSAETMRGSRPARRSPLPWSQVTAAPANRKKIGSSNPDIPRFLVRQRAKHVC